MKSSRTRRRHRPLVWGLITVALSAVFSTSRAADYYVAPAGKTENEGTRESPWDLSTAVGGTKAIKPGDTIFLLPGTYRRRPDADYEIRLLGSKDEPIHLRPVAGTRAIIDGGLAVQPPSASVWVWDLEILVSENATMPRTIQEPGSHPKSYGRPWGGLHMRGGTNCKYINLVIHDCAQGVSSWIGAEDIEIYGCLIYENGWKAPDRGHGHCIYTQNRAGTKAIRHCITSAKYSGSYTLHAYGSPRAYVDNLLVEENIAYDKGPFLIGGGRPSRHIRVFGNVLYAVDMRIGYNAPHNEDCEVRNNLIVNGSLSINRYKKAVNEGNTILKRGDKGKKGTEWRWFLNRYDRNRAHLAVFDWDGRGRVSVKATPFLTAGEKYRLMDPRDIHGKPVQRGVCRGDSITVSVRGEFSASVVFKEAAGE